MRFWDRFSVAVVVAERERETVVFLLSLCDGNTNSHTSPAHGLTKEGGHKLH